LFELSIGKRLLRKDFTNTTGDIPAYSANVFSPFVFVDRSNIDDWTTPYVLWGIDGEFVFNVMPAGTKFASTDHCGTIKILDRRINPYYLAYVLEENKYKYGFDRGLRASLNNMKQIHLSIPINSKGEFDETAQNEIAEAIVGLRQFRESALEKQTEIQTVKVIFEGEDYRYSYFPLPELFNTVKGLSKYTKKYGNTHSGPYPVFSASSNKPLTQIATFDYDGRYLTWSTNGFAGTILVLDGKFSINGDRGILLPKDGRKDLDFDYMKYVLEPLFRELAKGRKGDNGEDEFTKLYPSMLTDVMVPVPVDAEGAIDLALQKEIAAKYLAIQRYQQETVSLLDSIIQQKVSL
jgi:restriction endonuclease S subunit